MLEQISNTTTIDEFPLPMKTGTIGKHSVLCCASGKGQEETASAATLILERAKPSFVFLVGIAGGFSEQGVGLGDVVVAHFIHSFDYGKLVAGTFKRRPENDINCDRSLLSWAEVVAADRKGIWRDFIREARPDQEDLSRTKSHVDCYVASSNKVVDDPDHTFYATVADAFPEIHAVEMEGVGAGASARLAQSERAVRFIMIRGISDQPGTTAFSKEQRAQWKIFAVAAAAAFTRALIEVIPQRGGTPEAKGVARRGTPFVLPQTDEPTFTGRLAEITQLEEVLLRGEEEKISSIVGLTGSGGIGKSALACHFAELHQKDFPDGVIGLRVDGKSPEAIAREFLLECGLTVGPDDTRSPATLMQDTFRTRRALLIFDNAEDASVRALCPGGRECSVIITSRNRALPAALSIPARGAIDVEPLPAKDCSSLLEKILDGDQRHPTESETISVIINLVGNLPLAIQIVGATLRSQPWLSLFAYSEALRDEKRRLNILAIPDDYERDVRACLVLSLKTLKPQVLEIFGVLTVCSKEGFSILAAKNASGMDDSELNEALQTLHRMSLLNVMPGAHRFVYHPLLWVLGRETVTQDVIEASRKRHALEFIATMKDAPNSALKGEVDELLLAAQWLLDQQTVDYQFLIRVEPILTKEGRWSKALHLMSQFMVMAERMADADAGIHLRVQQAKYLTLLGSYGPALDVLLPTEGLLSHLELDANRERIEAMYLNTLGGALQRMGKFDDAVSAFQPSYDLLVKLADERGQAMVLNSLGGVLQRQGKFEEAVSAFQHSAEIEERIGNERGQAMVLNSLGGVLQRQGKFEEAVSAFQRSAEIEERIGNERGQAMVLNSLGGVLQRQGKFDEAVSAFQRSYDLLLKLADERGQAMVLNSLGGVLQRQGKFEEAVSAFQRSAEIEERIGNERGQAMVLNSLGGVLQRQGKFEEAVSAFQRSAEIEERIGNERGQAMVLNSLGGVLQRQGKFDEAASAFQRSYSISEKLGDDRSLAMVLNSLGGVLQRQGKFDEAVGAFQRSCEIGESIKDYRHVAMVLNSLGGVLQRQGKFDEAANAFQRSYSISEKLGDDRSLAMVLNSLGGVLQRQGKFDEAASSFQRSYSISEKLGDDRSLAMVLNSLGGVLQRQGKFDEAANAFQRSYSISEKLGDDRSLAMVLNSLGGVLQRQGKFDEAASSFQRSYSISEKLGDDRSLAMVLNSLGGVLQRQGKFDEAASAFQRSYSISEKLGDDRSLAMVLNSLGGVLQRQGKFDEAASAFQRSYSISEKLGDDRGLAMVLNSLGGVLQRQGKFDEAVSAFQRSYALLVKLADERGQAMVLNSLGGVLQRQRQSAQALAAYEKSIALGRKLLDKRHLAIVCTALGKFQLSQRQAMEAAESLNEAFDLEFVFRNKRGLKLVIGSLLRALRIIGNHERAIEVCQMALTLTPNDPFLTETLAQLRSLN